jgi:hypothetical protein
LADRCLGLLSILSTCMSAAAVADREASNFNNRAAHGHFVRGVEATIGDGSARIIERVRLPALTDKGVVDMWPPQNNWASAYVESVHAGIVGAGMPASVEDRIAASERQIDFVKAQEAGRMKKNEEAEMRAREHGTERRRLQAGG